MREKGILKILVILFVLMTVGSFAAILLTSTLTKPCEVQSNPNEKLRITNYEWKTLIDWEDEKRC